MHGCFAPVLLFMSLHTSIYVQEIWSSYNDTFISETLTPYNLHYLTCRLCHSHTVNADHALVHVLAVCMWVIVCVYTFVIVCEQLQVDLVDHFCLSTRVPRHRDGIVRPYIHLQLIVFNISVAMVARAAARIYLKLCTLFKITHGLFPFTSDVFTPHPNRCHYNNLPLLCQPFAHTNSFQSSFVPSTIAIWNHLPHDALTAHSSYSFKSRISPLFL